MVKALSTLILLLAFWLLCSGPYSLHAMKIALFGVGSSVLVLFIARRMDLLEDQGRPLTLGWRFILYLPWLFWQIFLANLDVARRVLSPSLPIDPGFIRVKTSQKTDLARVVYANSITLTPGTVTVCVLGDDFLVHAIAKEVGDDLLSGEMDRRVSALEVLD